MKISKILLLLFASATLFSCSHANKHTSVNIDPEMIQNDFQAWWSYYNTKTKLSSEFVPLDTLSNIITRDVFLKSLTSGNYIPVRLIGTDSTVSYQLCKLSASADTDIKQVIEAQASTEYAYYLMEGKKLPDFNFIDIEGNVFNAETTKGKIVVLKCWFIHCQKCVEEMPMLNTMVQEYKNRTDIVFISLAYDTKEQLKEFLSKRDFTYAVVADKQTYMDNDLKILGYPTHLIINKSGVITKVVRDGEELISFLKKETAK